MKRDSGCTRRLRVLLFLPFTNFSFRFRRRKFIKTAALSFRDTRAGARLISFLLHPTPVAGAAVACDPAVVIIQYVYTRGGEKQKNKNNCKKYNIIIRGGGGTGCTRCRQRFFFSRFFFPYSYLYFILFPARSGSTRV